MQECEDVYPRYKDDGCCLEEKIAEELELALCEQERRIKESLMECERDEEEIGDGEEQNVEAEDA